MLKLPASWYISYNSSIARIMLIATLAEFTVLLYLLLILIVTAVSLTVVLWAWTFFFQGYIYTEPSPGIYWQAPAAAAALTFGYLIWSLAIALSASATPTNLPIDSIFRFSPKEEMAEMQGRPAAKIWAIKRKKKGDDQDVDKVPYINKRDTPTKFHYEDTSLVHRPWQRQDVFAIDVEIPDKDTMRFSLTPTEQSDYRQYVSQDGWVIREYEDGPTGLPIKFRFTRLLWNLIFNFVHFVGWFAALWLLLRFQWAHALGLAVIFWVIATLVFLPIFLGYAGLVAANRHTVQTALLHERLP
jgi:hypothetical protein